MSDKSDYGREAIAQALATHAYMPCAEFSATVKAWWAQCEGCDWRGPRTNYRPTDEQRDHRAHIAEVVVATLTNAAEDVAEAIVRDRMAFYGYTPEEIKAAEDWPGHDASGCFTEGWDWVCTDENDKPNHPLRDELDLTAEFVMWVLEHPALSLPSAVRSELAPARWRIVTANDDHGWPCTVVDSDGRSLLGVHNGTPVIRSRDLAERIVAALANPTPTPARACVGAGEIEVTTSEERVDG